MGTKFAPATGSNTVTQFDKGSNVKFWASQLRQRLTLDGQKFAPATGSNAVTKFDKGFNVKFPADRLMNRLTLDGHQPTVATSSFLASHQVMR
jgi:hypothetical protein